MFLTFHRKNHIIMVDFSWMQDARCKNFFVFSVYWIFIIADTVSRFVKIDVRSHVLNLLIVERLLSVSNVMANQQPIPNETNNFGKWLTWHFFNADDNIDGLLALIYVSHCFFHSRISRSEISQFGRSTLYSARILLRSRSTSCEQVTDGIGMHEQKTC